MNRIIDIHTMPGFISLKGAPQAKLDAAQQALATTFAPEYAAYARAYGAASFVGHELTGICDFPRLSVVSVTREERALNPKISQTWYVIEQTHMDGVVIWQAPSGEVYQAQPSASPVLIADSMAEYLGL